jgi:methylmalonyl-CoA/ethylmalonyl-CoA epimerase
MDIGIIQLDEPDQIGIVVNNVDHFITQFNYLFGISGFEIIDWPIPGTDPESTYYGESAYWKMRTAFITLGTIQIEIVEPLEGRSIYKDFLEKNGPGLHHMRFTVTDFEKKVENLENAGIQMISSGKGMRSNSKWAYFDTFNILDGFYIELRTV